MNNQVFIKTNNARIGIDVKFPVNTIPTQEHIEWFKKNLPAAKVVGRGVPITLTDILSTAMENNIMVEAFISPNVGAMDTISVFPSNIFSNGELGESKALGISVEPVLCYRYVIVDKTRSRLYQNTSVIEVLVEGALEILKEQGALPTL